MNRYKLKQKTSCRTANIHSYLLSVPDFFNYNNDQSAQFTHLRNNSELEFFDNQSLFLILIATR